MKLNKIISAAAVFTLLASPLSATAAFSTAEPFDGTSSGTLIVAITNIVNAVLALVAVIAVVFIIIGGLRYITSQGDEDASAAAKGTILNVIIGVVVIALSAVIVNFFIKAIP